MKRMIIGAVVILLGLSPRAWSGVIETFDSAASAAANGWAGFNHTSGGNSVGFSATNHTTGDPAGEAGGTVARSARMYYADTTLGRTFNFNEGFTHAGELVVNQADNNGPSTLIGYFSTAKATANLNQDWLGLLVADNGGGGTYRLFSALSTSTGTLVTISALVLNVGTPYRWVTVYDPNIGNGKQVTNVYLVSDGSFVGQSDINLTAANRAAGASFNAFGISNTNVSANAAVTSIFIDNLFYLPEPTVAWMMCLGAMAAFRRRRGAVA